MQVPLGVQHNDSIAPEKRFTPRHVVEKLSLQGIEVRILFMVLQMWEGMQPVHHRHDRLCNHRWVSSST